MYRKLKAPQHQHDCSDCLFLGSLGSTDLYVHIGEKSDTHIVRYSSEGSDCYSSPDWNRKAFSQVDNQYDTMGLTPDERNLFLRRLVLFQVCACAFNNVLAYE